MFNFFNKDDNEPVISFVSTVPEIAEFEDVVPKKSSYYIPSWWKDLPRETGVIQNNINLPTVKGCPSFTDYFSQGYVLPAWCDIDLTYDSNNDKWSAFYANPIEEENKFNWTIHPNDQLVNHINPVFQGSSSTIVFKGNSPWKIITKPGWSVLQLPLFYHFNNDFAVMPGVIDSDILHDVNIQLMYFGDGKTISIKRGQPLVQYIPFKRDKEMSMSVRHQNEEDIKKIEKQNIRLFTKKRGTGSYRKMQIDRDRNK